MTLTVALLLLLQPAPELRQRVEAGMKAKAAGDLEGAVNEFQRVVELAPNLAAAHVNLGAVYYEKRDYSSAIGPLRRALELNPNLPGAEQMLGASLLARGYAQEAVAHLEKAGSNDLLGVALLESGRAREAVDLLEAALQKRKDDPDLLFYLSRAHAFLARQAADRLRSAGEGSPRLDQVIGESFAATGNREAAEKHFRRALKNRPDLSGIHHAIGELLVESGDYAGAEREFRAEASLSPGSAVTAWRLGSVLWQQGKAAEALSELKRANELQPEMPETMLDLGKALAATGEYAAAEGLLAKVTQVEQDSQLAEAAYFQLSQVYRKLGRTAEAARAAKRFDELRRNRR